MTRTDAPVRAPDIAELETLVVCAAEGSFVAAAARLGISRPAVAKRIGNLEVLAGKPLVHRGGRGVRLSDAGATLLAGARRMLDERDVLLGLLREIRGDGPSAIAGLRELLGHAPDASRAGQQSEARLAETERVLEIVLRSTATGVAISDPDTAVIHEANDAFCRFVGRPRSELLGRRATDVGTWYDGHARTALVAQLRSTGALERVVIRVKRPDGTTRDGETSASLISLAGSAQMLSTVNDVTEKRRVDLEHQGTLVAYRALVAMAARLGEGQPPLESLEALLPELHRSGKFRTALLCDAEGNTSLVLGDAPWPGLGQALSRSGAPTGTTARLIKPTSRQSDREIGFAAELAIGHQIVLLSGRVLPSSAQTLVLDVLEDLAAVIRAHSGHAPQRDGA
jgi:PAS domain S-box-containing protein